jgi:hypothetical protein
MIYGCRVEKLDLDDEGHIKIEYPITREESQLKSAEIFFKFLKEDANRNLSLLIHSLNSSRDMRTKNI